MIFLIIIVVAIYLIVKSNEKKQKAEEDESIITNEKGEKKQICFWCKQEINIGAKICPYCRKVPTKSGRDNRQVEIFITVILILIAIMLWF